MQFKLTNSQRCLVVGLIGLVGFLANVRYMSSSVRPSVCLSYVCNVGAPYSGDWNFGQCFYAI